VKEKGITFLKVGTETGFDSDAQFELQGALRNPFGYGEIIKLSSATTMQKAKEYMFGLYVPNVGVNKLDLNISAKSRTDSQVYYTSVKNEIDSILLELSTPDRKHHFIGECAFRDEVPTTKVSGAVPSTSTAATTSSAGSAKSDGPGLPATAMASAVTTNTAMSSVKTSLKYLCTLLDSRDSACNPSRGSYLQGSVELATPPGKHNPSLYIFLLFALFLWLLLLVLLAC
jgi:outer membrane protein assembly factor BamA